MFNLRKIIFLFLCTFNPLYSQSSNNITHERLTFNILNRITGYSIIDGRDLTDKIVPITTTMLDLLYGSPNGFLYSSFRVSYPLVLSSTTEQLLNASIQTKNNLNLGFAIGGGYGLTWNRGFVTHVLKFIFAMNVDFGIWNDKVHAQNINAQNTLGVEFAMRYYYYYKTFALITGIDTSVSINTRKNEKENMLSLSSIGVSYGGSLGFGF